MVQPAGRTIITELKRAEIVFVLSNLLYFIGSSQQHQDANLLMLHCKIKGEESWASSKLYICNKTAGTPTIGIEDDYTIINHSPILLIFVVT